jgi:hypothetical protein
MHSSAVRQASAIIPIAMSITALAVVLGHIWTSGTAPQPDEGTAAHIWQLMMVGQAPIILFYSMKWLPRTPRVAMAILAAQIGAALAAAFPVFWLGWQ